MPDSLKIALITPALHDANNGNWQTAQRWATMLNAVHSVDVAQTWDTLPLALDSYDAMIALHARRSAASVTAFATRCPAKPLIVVLTGTDLYRDIATDTCAQASLQHASTLVVLQAQGVFDLPAHVQHKAVTVFQSAPRQAHRSHSGQALEVCVLGHLRLEKSPETVFAVAQRLAMLDCAIRITHIGNALEERFGIMAERTQAAHPQHYRWLGGLSHADSVAQIAHSDVLLHPSAMEGGALAIIEAVQSGTAVIASRVAGHIGLLGHDYWGLFDWGDATSCATLLQRFANEPTFRAQLLAQCAMRSALFEPDIERQTLLNLLTI